MAPQRHGEEEESGLDAAHELLRGAGLAAGRGAAEPFDRRARITEHALAAPEMAAARQAIEAQDWGRALNELNIAARAEPRNADVHNLLGYTWRKRATPDITKAFEHYYTALRLDPRHKGAHEYIGQAYLMEKRPEEANKHLAQLESLCGNKTCPEYVTLAKAIADYRPAQK